MDNLQIKYISVADLIPYAMNSRTHSESQIKQIAASIKEFGFCNPVLIDDDNGIIAGHGRVMAAEKLGMDTIPAVVLGNLTETQKKAYVIADNQLSLNAGWDLEILRLEVESLMEDDFNLELLGFDDGFLDDLSGCLDDFNELVNVTPVSLADRFLIPPFSVLNAREGWWVERKKKWLALGLKSEMGRDDLLCYSKSSQTPEMYEKKAKYEKKIGRKVTFDEFFEDNPDLKPLSGTSIFDPVLCEIVYRWFSPECGVVLDPFAGGSVRGVVASMLNRRYIGGDLRHEQVDENRKQGGEICADNQYPPAWVCGDSRNIHKTCADVEADLIFTCPPYADLEVYSDDPDDISTLGYAEFKQAYFQIIKNACTLLKNDRFACIVVGDVRDKKGNYYNFVSDTIQAFLEAGLKYYNEAILITQAGSLAIRAARAFTVSRKLGKTHQNVLVFVKGDAKKATQFCGDVEVALPEDMEDDLY